MNYSYDEAFFREIRRQLNAMGYVLHIKIPDNRLLQTSNSRTKYEPIVDSGQTYSFDEFLNNNKDYPSILIIGEKSDKSENVKILIRNNPGIYTFKEEDLPSEVLNGRDGHIVAVCSKDPLTSYTLSNYLLDQLRTGNTFKQQIIPILAIVSLVWSGIIILDFFSEKKLKFSDDPSTNVLIKIISLLVSMFAVYIMLKLPKPGIRIAPRNSKIKPFFADLFKGKFKDNLFLILILLFIGAVLSELVKIIFTKLFT